MAVALAPAGALGCSEPGPAEELAKLEYLSLVSKVCTELDNHLGINDKDLGKPERALGWGSSGSLRRASRPALCRRRPPSPSRSSDSGAGPSGRVGTGNARARDPVAGWGPSREGQGPDGIGAGSTEGHLMPLSPRGSRAGPSGCSLHAQGRGEVERVWDPRHLQSKKAGLGRSRILTFCFYFVLFFSIGD